ncbi:unnamed protein product [Periconia digitata]|uniref:Uncharacterized protein n=1 Tax=Periconia digitata TaxID=1303443 RepID=A0A9W4XWA1_9PLEO|nr:unnamed protein product [Periconia digitata]
MDKNCDTEYSRISFARNNDYAKSRKDLGMFLKISRALCMYVTFYFGRTNTIGIEIEECT